jgi:hypothetical protein
MKDLAQFRQKTGLIMFNGSLISSHCRRVFLQISACKCLKTLYLNADFTNVTLLICEVIVISKLFIYLVVLAYFLFTSIITYAWWRVCCLSEVYAATIKEINGILWRCPQTDALCVGGSYAVRCSGMALRSVKRRRARNRKISRKHCVMLYRCVELCGCCFERAIRADNIRMPLAST